MEDLTDNTWATGTISAGYAEWYGFYAMDYVTYYIEWQDRDNSPYTGDIMVSAYENGMEIFSRSDSCSESFTATHNDYIVLKVEPYDESSAGSYRIMYYSIDVPAEPPADSSPEPADLNPEPADLNPEPADLNPEPADLNPGLADLNP